MVADKMPIMYRCLFSFLLVCLSLPVCASVRYYGHDAQRLKHASFFSKHNKSLSDICIVSLSTFDLNEHIDEACRHLVVTHLYSNDSGLNTLKQLYPALTMSVLYRNASLAHFIKLSELIYGKRKPLLVTSSKKFHNKRLNNVYQQTLSIRHILENINISPVLIVMPNRRLYKSSSIRPLLRALYRHDRSLIGFSKTMSDMGAIASLSVRRDLYHQFLVDWFVAGNYTVDDYYPGIDYLDVHFNHATAESLNVRLPRQQQVREVLK